MFVLGEECMKNLFLEYGGVVFFYLVIFFGIIAIGN